MVRRSVIISGALLLVFICLVVIFQYVNKWRSETVAFKLRKLVNWPGSQNFATTQPTSISVGSVNCCALINEKSLQATVCNEPGRGIPTSTSAPCTCADYLYCRLAVVTAISSDHFGEAQDMIHSAQKNAPNTKIFVYDLGLKEHERKNLSEHCFVEVRTFPFSKYPSYFRALALNEAWKPIIINELAKEYDVILYGDASLRILKPVKDEVLPHLMEFPFVAAPAYNHAVIPVTPPEMYNYLGLNLTRMEAWKVFPDEIQSTMMCVWATELMKDKFLKNWIDCAMHEECMSPKGYVRRTDCHLERTQQPNYRGEYTGCMRCQSIVNILLYREFGAVVWKKLHRPELNGNAWTIRKFVTHMFTGNLCPVTGM